MITVAGASMEPVYRNGDRVLVRRLGRRGRTGIGRDEVVVATWRPPSGAPPGPRGADVAGPRHPGGVRPGDERSDGGRPDGRQSDRGRSGGARPDGVQPGGARPDGRGWIIKRVVAGPGDPVPAGMGPALAAEAGMPVPRDRFVVMGDNAAHSHDSRHTGYVERDDIVGVVIRRLEHRR
ncbi:S26 family signal peptidase [Streptomyces sp. NPDC014734]|uniref:S26 family signal peptidase n=1 Tax=Streptomyces sp. NPDC014734 TaxID=3364886 RepID=UPI0036F8D9AF